MLGIFILGIIIGIAQGWYAYRYKLDRAARIILADPDYQTGATHYELTLKGVTYYQYDVESVKLLTWDSDTKSWKHPKRMPRSLYIFGETLTTLE